MEFDLSPIQMARSMTAALQTSQSTWSWGMTPELAYGRHRGPARLRSRQAAVAAVLVRDPLRGWQIPLTRRPTALRHHGGQICLPGGRIESGETPEQAALREFEEELGIRPNIVATCGQLPKQYVYASDNQVTPMVFVALPPDGAWSPDPVEVDEVLELHLSAITRDRTIRRIDQTRSIRQSRPILTPDAPRGLQRSATNANNSTLQTIGSLRFRAPAFTHRDWQIWGATAVILDQLAQCLLAAVSEAPDGFDSAKLASSGN